MQRKIMQHNTSSCVIPRVNTLRHGRETSLMSTSAVTAVPPDSTDDDDNCTKHMQLSYKHVKVWTAWLQCIHSKRLATANIKHTLKLLCFTYVHFSSLI